MPPQNDEPDDIDSQYRRWSAADPVRPADSVASAVLAHAAKLAAQRNAATTGNGTRPRASYRWRLPLIGGLAAATMAGLLVTPRFITSDAPAVKSEAPTVSDAQMFASPEPAPAVPREGYVPSAPAPAERAPQAPSRKLATPADTVGNARARVESPAAAAAPQAHSYLDEVAVTGGLAAPALAGNSNSKPIVAGRKEITASRAASQIDSGADLRRAANTGDVQGLTILLDQQSEIESRDSAGRTALMLAASNGHDAVVTTLLLHGADPNVTDAYGETPLQAALAGNHREIAAALRRAGAR